MIYFFRNLFMVGVVGSSALSAAQVATATYTGLDGGIWHVASNWDTGMVPDANTNVIINGKRVTGDENAVYELKNILITSFGSVETKAGSTWLAEDETIVDGTLIHRSTNAINTGTGTLSFAGSGSSGGVWLNPTPKSKRIIVLQSSVQLRVGIGGSIAASAAAMGPGTYATLTGEQVTLAGELQLESFYGFVPTPGQQFQIITSTGGTFGQFDGLGEGSIVGGLGGYAMAISYAGGDGDDVVLTAMVPEPISMAGLGLGLVALAARRKKK
ncbi:MAG TPA: PEP-CTERM sorting domain-containing protein [Fimbriimonas sp.]|nr:PEP-CTERM sorting domain-containing protein [Fimbriimonas sp.]